jgi:hypothetical protein
MGEAACLARKAKIVWYTQDMLAATGNIVSIAEILPKPQAHQ